MAFQLKMLGAGLDTMFKRGIIMCERESGKVRISLTWNNYFINLLQSV